MRIITILFSLFIVSYCHAQTREVTKRNLAWGCIFGQHFFTPSWNVNLDVQTRYEYTDNDWFAWFIRPGLTWKSQNGILFTGGIGVFALYTNPNSRPPRPEFRTWQEVGKMFPVKKHTFYPRYRFEQRFIRQYGVPVFEENFSFASYRSRLRLDYSYDITPENVSGFLLLGGNEYMINTTTKGKFSFDQNRAYAGIGYRMNEFYTLQLTYLNLFQRTSTNIYEQHHTIRLIFVYKFVKPEFPKQ